MPCLNTRQAAQGKSLECRPQSGAPSVGLHGNMCRPGRLCIYLRAAPAGLHTSPGAGLVHALSTLVSGDTSLGKRLCNQRLVCISTPRLLLAAIYYIRSAVAFRLQNLLASVILVIIASHMAHSCVHIYGRREAHREISLCTDVCTKWLPISGSMTLLFPITVVAYFCYWPVSKHK